MTSDGLSDASPTHSGMVATERPRALSDGEGALEQVLEVLSARPDDLGPIVRASSEALIAFDPSRRILCANRSAARLFGYEEGALDGLSTDQLLPERLRQPAAPPMAALPDLVHVDLSGMRRDGTELSVAWMFRSLHLPSGDIFVMAVHDRAAADRALDALRASEERFRLLVDGVKDYAILMLDPSGHVSSWNAGAERIKGWTTEEILGKPYDIFFSAEDRAAGVPGKLLEAAVRVGSQQIEGWRVRKDGSRFRASAYLTALRSADGELRGFAKITRDLTKTLEAEELERRLAVERAGRVAAEAAEQRVRASEERLRRLQRVTAALSEAATPSAVAAVVLDQSLQALEAAGGAIYALADHGRSLDLLGQRGHPDSPLADFARIPLELRAPLSDAARERTPRFYESVDACEELYPDLRDAIRSGDFEASAALPLLTQGKLLGVLGIRFRERRRFDENDRLLMLTLAELCAQALDRARLLAAERQARAESDAANRSKDEFLAMLGHELRNPLAPIVTALSLMKLRGKGEADKERTVIERQVDHLVRLVDDLLDVSRITEGKVALKKERVELATIVARGVELSSPLLEQRLQHLSLRVPEGLWVDGDATRLAQVVSNLVTNSAKYTHVGGHIEIEGSRRLDRVILTVRDDGIGIAPAMLPRVFDLFAQERQSIDRSQGGLGLGLAIVKSLVAMHDGAVAVTSEGHEKGSAFTVELPAATHQASPSSTPRKAAARAAGGAGAARRVLVVDDNLDAAELLAEVLRARGFVVEIAIDGPAALRIAESFRPEIALLDIGLPVMDGYEVARRLRSTDDAIRLIAVTGYGQDSDRALALAAGFDTHMIKPVQLDALQAALGEEPVGAP